MIFDDLVNKGYVNLFHILFVSYLLYALAMKDVAGESNVITKAITIKNFMLATAVGVFLYHMYRYNQRQHIFTWLADQFTYKGTDAEYERDFYLST